MSNFTKILLASVAGFMFLIVAGFVMAYFSAKFTAEGFESSLVANEQKMQSMNGTMHNRLAMNGFTVEKYGKDFIASVTANAERYKNDQGTMMKWVQEAASAQLSPDVYKQFMNAIDSAYMDFEAAQTQKISVAQEYDKFLDASFMGMLAKWQGYPTTEGARIMKLVISTSQTKKAWQTGTDDAVNPFESK